MPAKRKVMGTSAAVRRGPRRACKILVLNNEVAALSTTTAFAPSAPGSSRASARNACASSALGSITPSPPSAAFWALSLPGSSSLTREQEQRLLADFMSYTSESLKRSKKMEKRQQLHRQEQSIRDIVCAREAPHQTCCLLEQALSHGYNRPVTLLSNFREECGHAFIGSIHKDELILVHVRLYREEYESMSVKVENRTLGMDPYKSVVWAAENVVVNFEPLTKIDTQNIFGTSMGLVPNVNERYERSAHFLSAFTFCKSLKLQVLHSEFYQSIRWDVPGRRIRDLKKVTRRIQNIVLDYLRPMPCFYAQGAICKVANPLKVVERLQQVLPSDLANMIVNYLPHRVTDNGSLRKRNKYVLEPISVTNNRKYDVLIRNPKLVMEVLCQHKELFDCDYNTLQKAFTTMQMFPHFLKLSCGNKRNRNPIFAREREIWELFVRTNFHFFLLDIQESGNWFRQVLLKYVAQNAEKCAWFWHDFEVNVEK
jgi:hypothetical protein